MTIQTDLSLIGKAVPEFTALTTGGEFSIAEVVTAPGKPLVLYFYPKDSTPGCTTEALQFRDRHDEFLALGCTIVGVSRDSLKSHANFRAKLGLPFALLADTDEVVCQMFGVIKSKNMYGKQVQGIERSTFLIDGSGVVRNEWRKVKADGHADQVLAALKAL